MPKPWSALLLDVIVYCSRSRNTDETDVYGASSTAAASFSTQSIILTIIILCVLIQASVGSGELTPSTKSLLVRNCCVND